MSEPAQPAARDDRDCNSVNGAVSVHLTTSAWLNDGPPGRVARTDIALPRGQPKVAFTLDGVLSHSEAEALMAAAEAVGFQPAGLGSAGKQERSELRTSMRLISDDPVLRDCIWRRVRDEVPATMHGGHRVIGLNEQLKFLRYEPGQHFAAHVDGSFRRRPGQRSRLTLQLYLSEEGVAGGATRFVGGASSSATQHADVDCAPTCGRVLVFDHGVLHEGAAVEKGVKYTIRTDVEYGEPTWASMVQAACGLGGPPAQSRRRAAAALGSGALLLLAAAGLRRYLVGGLDRTMALLD